MFSASLQDRVFFYPPARVVAGPGVRADLPALLARLGYRCGVLITDRFFEQHTPWVREFIEGCRAQGLDTLVYAGGLPDPSIALCDEASAELLARLQGRVPDHVVALGGGSNIDLAKVLALTLPEGRPTRDFVGDLAGVRPLPLIAIPTTSGTGSEATPGAILVDPANATKVAVMDNSLRPVIAVIDPELSYTCPPGVTADAGIDAFTHAIESYLTLDAREFDRAGHPDPGYSGRSPLTMMFARESMRLCIAWMTVAYRDGSHTEARIGMAYASLYAGLSYGTAGLHAVHGIAYAVAGLTHRSHGTTNAVMLPYVLDALREARHHELLDVAGLLGLDTSDAERAVRAVPVRVREMIAAMDLPTDLRALGITEDQLASLLADALAVTRLAKAFPVSDAAAHYDAIVRHAFDGHLAGAVGQASTGARYPAG